jgi:hypothetical protein
VAAANDFAHDVGEQRGAAPNTKETCPCVMAIQEIKHARRDERVRPVIEGKGNAAFGGGQGREAHHIRAEQRTARPHSDGTE